MLMSALYNGNIWENLLQRFKMKLVTFLNENKFRLEYKERNSKSIVILKMTFFFFFFLLCYNRYLISQKFENISGVILLFTIFFFFKCIVIEMYAMMHRNKNNRGFHTIDIWIRNLGLYYTNVSLKNCYLGFKGRWCIEHAAWVFMYVQTVFVFKG